MKGTEPSPPRAAQRRIDVWIRRAEARDTERVPALYGDMYSRPGPVLALRQWSCPDQPRATA